MTQQLTIRAVAASDWPDYAARFAGLTFEQSLTYSLAAARRIGGRAEFIGVEQAGRPVAGAALRVKTVPGLRRGVAWIPSGPLMLPDQVPGDLFAVLSTLRRQVVQRAGHILRLRLPGLAPQHADLMRDTAAAAAFSPTLRAPLYRSVALDLRLPEATLMQRLEGKWRTDLRYALKSDLGMDHGNSPALQARFLALFRVVQTAKGFAPDITPEFHFGLSGPDYRLDVLIATKDGQDLGGIVIGTSGQTATYLFGATAEAGRHLRAGYFLTWQGMALARQRGLHWYDLGGIDREANPDVARFKDRMNGVSILSEAFEARPTGLIAPVTLVLENLRARLKKRGKERP